MTYLFETNLMEKKPIFVALIDIYGINKTTSLFICKKVGFSKNLKIKDLSKTQTSKLVKIIEFLNIKN